MCIFRFAVSSLVAVFVTGCATQPEKEFPPPEDYVPIGKVEIASRFVTTEVTAETLGAEANRCVPQLDGNSQNIQKSAKEFPSRKIVSFEHVSSANIFLLRQRTVICINRSSNKFPIFAAEAFLDTANPSGVPPDVVDEWNKQIARLIATQGVAKVAYVFDNGNAFVVSYWIEPTGVFVVHYASAFKKAGEWEAGKYDVKFAHPTMTSVTETKRSGSRQKSHPLLHRLP